MNWRVMSALRNHPGVALKIRWNGGKTFLIPAGKAQPDNGLSYDSLYQLEKLYAEPDGHHNEGLSKPAPSLPAVQPSTSSVPPVESSLPLEPSSSSEHVPERPAGDPLRPAGSCAAGRGPVPYQCRRDFGGCRYPDRVNCRHLGGGVSSPQEKRDRIKTEKILCLWRRIFWLGLRETTGFDTIKKTGGGKLPCRNRPIKRESCCA